MILNSAIKAGFTIEGFLDDNPIIKDIFGFHCIGTVSDINNFIIDHLFICAIGKNSIRMKFDSINKLEWATIIHPSANIGLDVEIDSGSVIMAGVAINPSSHIGRHCIINTNSVIEHDCMISDYVHISPGAILCGDVFIGKETWIGAGAVIKNGVSICANAIIGAGAVVVKDINIKGKYIGVPAKII